MAQTEKHEDSRMVEVAVLPSIVEDLVYEVLEPVEVEWNNQLEAVE